MDEDRQLNEWLSATGQCRLGKHLQQLPESRREDFRKQVSAIDWRMIQRLFQSQSAKQTLTSPEHHDANLARPPEKLIRQPSSVTDHIAWQQAREIGLRLLREGKVAAVVVAGGQGTRLGFDRPKGMFPIGPVSRHSLFQIFCEQILARGREAGRAIPYGVMTSDATHSATVDYFQEHRNFGLSADQLHFFQQASLPAVDAVTGQALLSEPGQLALSPDGHGGMLRALVKSGLMEEWQRRGVETVFYHQVDNPTTQVCDPAFLGFHVQRMADVSTKVAAKRDAAEKMGVVVSVGNSSKIIEYSDLPRELAEKTDSQGNLMLWAGNTAIHAFRLEFLNRMANDGDAFPFHTARKVVPHLSDDGQMVAPDHPNALKFEQFIFDLLPAATTSLVVEADRAAEFNPVKNNEGRDSPATCQAAMLSLHRRWIRASGAEIGDQVPVEISPLFALDENQVKQRLNAGDRFDQPTFLT